MYLYNGISVNFKYITQYLFLFSIALISASILENGIALLPAIGSIYFLLRKQNDSLVLFLISWLYISNFFLSQGMVTNALAVQLSNCRYYIFIAFVYYYKVFSYNNVFAKKLILWCILYIVFELVFELIIHRYFGLGILIQPYFIYIFFLIQFPLDKQFSNRLFNLFLAIGLLQLIISIMQYSAIIAPPVSTSSGLRAGVTTIYSGIDDAAVGTMGSQASNQTSWIGTIIFVFLAGIGLRKRSIRISVFSLIFLLQYAVVDSKTMLGLTILAIALLLLKVGVRKLLMSKNAVFIIVLVLFGYGLKSSIDTYYRQNFYDSGIEGAIENTESSVSDVSDNYNNWGKFTGFLVVYHNLVSQSPLTVLIGDGQSIHDVDSAVRLSDDSNMARNNFTNSLSAWISIFNRTGIIGVTIVVWFFIIVLHSIRKYKWMTIMGHSFSQSAQVVLIILILEMFIYIGLSFADLAFNFIIMFYALGYRIEKSHKSYVASTTTILGKSSVSFMK